MPDVADRPRSVRRVTVDLTMVTLKGELLVLRSKVKSVKVPFEGTKEKGG